MDKTWIEVVDNIVKIGLPSIITGLVTILGMRYSAKSSQDKFLLEHKVKLLEKISDDIDIYFNALDGFLSRPRAMAHELDHDIDYFELDEHQLTGIKERDKLLVESWVKRQSSVSKLRLLRADKVVDELGVCVQLDYEIRNDLIFKKRCPGFNSMRNTADLIRAAKKSVHSELANFYQNVAR